MSVAARAHLEALAAHPRPAGSEAEAAARAHCARVLRGLGYSLREEPFAYSSFPGRWGTPLGAVAAAFLLVAVSWFAAAGRPIAALALLAVKGGALALATLWLARYGVLRFPWMRARSVNLAAVRGPGEPAVWLVAHLDSKSQPVPMLLRAAGITGHLVAWVAALLVVLGQAVGLVPALPGLWLGIAGVGVLAGLPVMASVVQERSPGALDDASGVATVLRAAESLDAALPVGILLTSAEELGLAGARAWAAGHHRGTALNVDGVDDAGVATWMFSGRRSPRLLDAAARASRETGIVATPRSLIPGVLVDAVALAEAGWEAMTLSRGTVRTLARIHTPADDLAALEGHGVEEAARLLARTAMEICAWKS